MKFHKTLYARIFCFLFIQQIAAQNITGRIVDAKTDEPMPFVNVFVSGSTRGTQSDIKGNFSLNQLPLGYLKLVASMVGFRSFERELVLKPNDIPYLKIALIADEKLLNEVKVSGKKDKHWKRNYADFEKTFLGRSKNVRRTKVLNRFDVNVVYKRPILTANADRQLKIKNDALGYDINYDLSYFRSEKRAFQFGGNMFFSLIEPKDEQEKGFFEKNRAKAFRGSLRHFLVAVAKKTTEKEGFRVYIEGDTSELISRSRTFANSLKNGLKAVSLDTLVRYDPQLQRAFLPNHRYEVHYLHNGDNDTFYADLSHEVSWIEIKDGVLFFSYNGIAENPQQVVLMGSMGKRRVADFVPNDYELPHTAIDSVQDSRMIPNHQPQEKIFIRTDRDAYFLQDTIWFKGYVLDATTHKPSPSEVLHLSLRNEKKVFFQGICQVKEGIAQGFIPIPDSLNGSFQLIAHTDWARNFDEQFFFRKSIALLPKSPIIEAKNPNDIQMQFFPEGGNLVAGLSNRVGIRATYADGSYAIISGKIIDSTGLVLLQIQEIRGVGECYIAPQKDQVIRFVLDNGRSYDLMPTLKNGYILQADALKDTANVLIKIINNLNESDYKPLRLLVHKRSQIMADANITPKRNLTLVRLPKDDISDEGIVNILLLDALGHKIAERIFYHYDRASNLCAIAKSESKGIEVQVFDQDSNAVEGTLLVLATDSRFVSDNAPNLNNYLFLSSDLQLSIENNGHLLDTTLAAKKRLDLLLLANIPRNYNPIDSLRFERELGMKIRGKIWGYNNKKQTAWVTGFVGTKNNFRSFDVKANLYGSFVSPPMLLEDTARIMLQARGEDLTINVDIDEPVVFIPKWIPLPNPHFTIEFDSMAMTKATNSNNKKINKIDLRRNYSRANQSIEIGTGATQGMLLNDILRRNLKGVTIRNDSVLVNDATGKANKQKLVAVFIDGVPLTFKSISSMSAEQLEGIDIIRDSLLLAGFGSMATHGAINVLSKDGSFLVEQKINASYQIGLMPQRDFIAPNVATMLWKIESMGDFYEKLIFKLPMTQKPQHILLEGISTTGKIIEENIKEF